MGHVRAVWVIFELQLSHIWGIWAVLKTVCGHVYRHVRRHIGARRACAAHRWKALVVLSADTAMLAQWTCRQHGHAVGDAEYRAGVCTSSPPARTMLAMKTQHSAPFSTRRWIDTHSPAVSSALCSHTHGHVHVQTRVHTHVHTRVWTHVHIHVYTSGTWARGHAGRVVGTCRHSGRHSFQYDAPSAKYGLGFAATSSWGLRICGFRRHVNVCCPHRSALRQRATSDWPRSILIPSSPVRTLMVTFDEGGASLATTENPATAAQGSASHLASLHIGHGCRRIHATHGAGCPRRHRRHGAAKSGSAARFGRLLRIAGAAGGSQPRETGLPFRSGESRSHQR